MNDPADVGQRLRRAREARGLSLSRAAQAIGADAVSPLETLERGDAAEIGGHVRLLALLRVYARFLGLDAEPLLLELSARGGQWGAGGDGQAPSFPGGPVEPLDPHAPRRRRRRRRIAAAAVAAVMVLIAAGVVAAVVLGDVADGLEPSQLLSALPVVLGTQWSAPPAGEGS